MNNRTKLTPHDRRRMAVAAPCDEDTIIRAYSGQQVRPLSLLRIQGAATALGLPPPPEAAKPRGAR